MVRWMPDTHTTPNKKTGTHQNQLWGKRVNVESRESGGMFCLPPPFTSPGKVAVRPLRCGFWRCKDEGFVHGSNIQNSLLDIASTERSKAQLLTNTTLQCSPPPTRATRPVRERGGFGGTATSHHWLGLQRDLASNEHWSPAHLTPLSATEHHWERTESAARSAASTVLLLVRINDPSGGDGGPTGQTTRKHIIQSFWNTDENFFLKANLDSNTLRNTESSQLCGEREKCKFKSVNATSF